MYNRLSYAPCLASGRSSGLRWVVCWSLPSENTVTLSLPNLRGAELLASRERGALRPSLTLPYLADRVNGYSYLCASIRSRGVGRHLGVVIATPAAGGGSNLRTVERASRPTTETGKMPVPPRSALATLLAIIGCRDSLPCKTECIHWC
jgi:hypothetical protein